MTTPTPSFEKDVRPLFRDKDRSAMLAHFDLWRRDDVESNYDAIDAALKKGTMPCDGDWTPEELGTLERWAAAGFPA